ADHGRPTRRKFERDDAAGRDPRGVEQCAGCAVDRGRDVAGDGQDLIGVPIPRLNARIDRAGPEDAAPVDEVEGAPVSPADVGTGTFHAAVGERFASDQDAGQAGVTVELELESQAEVLDIEVALELRITSEARRAADDGTVFDLPYRRITVPTSQVVAVE